MFLEGGFSEGATRSLAQAGCDFLPREALLHQIYCRFLKSELLQLSLQGK